ncbi:MAG: FecR domain-containing protein [Planctomycetes bacterium]|nr:FecR domain-containing protein [Planctomycetota bacterium]
MDRCPSWEAWSLWIDAEAPGDAHGDVGAHLASCVACRGTVASLRGVDEGVSDAARVSSEPPARSGFCPSAETIAAYTPGAGWEAHLSDCALCTHLVAQARAAAAAPARSSSGRRLRPLATAAALLACAATAWAFLAARHGSDDLLRLGVVEASGVETLVLWDGTSLELSPGTSVADAPPGPGERRRVRLARGVVLASVPSSAAGFVVETQAAVVRVVGTRFEVRSASLPTGEPASSVRVFQGRVEVEAGGGKIPLDAGWSAYAVPGAPPLVQEGVAMRGPEAVERLQAEYRSAAATDLRARHALWIAAILATSGPASPAAPTEAGGR